MKFRDFLDEKYIENKNAFKEIELMKKGFMPITPSIMKEFERDMVAYHATSIKKAKDIIELQGKRKDIATFTVGSYGIAAGAYENSEIIFTLSGKTSFQSNYDLTSALDRNGHRWLDNMKLLAVNNGFTVKMNKAIIEKYDLKDRFSISNFIDNLSNKEKKEFIAFYYDTSKKLIDKKLLKAIEIDAEKGYAGKFENNEIFLHDFKIMKTLLIYDGSSYVEDKSLDFKVNGGISRSSVAKLKL